MDTIKLLVQICAGRIYEFKDHFCRKLRLSGHLWSKKDIEVFMARVTVEDCIEKVENRFELIIAASQRAREIDITTRPTWEFLFHECRLLILRAKKRKPNRCRVHQNLSKVNVLLDYLFPF